MTVRNVVNRILYSSVITPPFSGNTAHHYELPLRYLKIFRDIHDDYSWWLPVDLTLPGLPVLDGPDLRRRLIGNVTVRSHDHRDRCGSIQHHCCCRDQLAQNTQAAGFL